MPGKGLVIGLGFLLWAGFSDGIVVWLGLVLELRLGFRLRLCVVRVADRVRVRSRGINWVII